MSSLNPLSPVDLLAELVRYDSSTVQGNLALIDHVAVYLKRHCIDCSVTIDPVANQANLLARVGGNSANQGLLIVGHSDVVSAAETGWRSDPFQLTVDGNRLVGRGACEMKGFLATVLSLAPALNDRVDGVPVYVGITFNGESDFLGAKRLMCELNRDAIKPLAVLLGKPTNLFPVTRHKGLTRIVTQVQTAGGHAALRHESVNALWLASHLIEYLEKLEHEARRIPDPQFDIKPAWTTINVGSIYGGSESNTVPGQCTFEWEIRDVQTFVASEVLQQFTRYCEAIVRELSQTQAELRVQSVQEYCAPPFNVDDDNPLHAAALSLGNGPATTASANHTEAAVFHENKLPVVVCGPGDINNSHCANEYLETEALAQCEHFVRDLIQRLDHTPVKIADHMAA